MSNEFMLALVVAFCVSCVPTLLFHRAKTTVLRQVLQPIALHAQGNAHPLRRWIARLSYLSTASVYAYPFTLLMVVSFLTSSDGGLKLGQEVLSGQPGTFETLAIGVIVFALQMFQIFCFDLAHKGFRATGFWRINFLVGALGYTTLAFFSVTLAMACWLTNMGVMDDLAEQESSRVSEGFEAQLGELHFAVGEIEAASKDLAAHSQAQAEEEEARGGTCGKSAPGKGPILQLRRDENEATRAVERGAIAFAAKVEGKKAQLTGLLESAADDPDKDAITKSIAKALRELDREMTSYEESVRDELAPYEVREDLATTHPVHKTAAIVPACPDQTLTNKIDKIHEALAQGQALTRGLEPPELFDNHSASARWMRVLELLVELARAPGALQLSILQALVLGFAPLTDVLVLCMLLLRAFDRRARLVRWLNEDASALDLCAGVLAIQQTAAQEREIQRKRRFGQLDLFALARKTSPDALDDLLEHMVQERWVQEGTLTHRASQRREGLMHSVLERAEELLEGFANKLRAWSDKPARVRVQERVPPSQQFYIMDHIVLEVLEQELRVEIPRARYRGEGPQAQHTSSTNQTRGEDAP